MIRIKIRECFPEGKEWHHNARTDDESVAISRALRRHFGAGAWWWADSGLGPDFGQVMRSCGNSSSRSLTGRCRLDIE